MVNKIKEYLLSKPSLRPLFLLLQMLNRWLWKLRTAVAGIFRTSQRVFLHIQTIWFLAWVVLPLWFRSRTRPVAFVRHMAMGDIICTFPAVLELKKRHPNTTFIYFCRPNFECLPRMGGVTDHIAWPPNIELIESTYSFLFSAIYKFIYSDEMENTPSTESVVAEFCRQHHVPVTDAHSPLEISATAVSRVKMFLEQNRIGDGPKIIIHPGPTWAAREWPTESWNALLHSFREQGFIQIIQVGASRRGDLVVPDFVLPNIISAVDKLTMEESIALVSLCDVVVGIDSGFLHVAASLGKPFVGIFGPTSPRYRFSADSSRLSVASAADCQGCHHRVPRLHWITGCPFDLKCMKLIRPPHVLSMCLTALSEKPLSPGQSRAFSA